MEHSARFGEVRSILARPASQETFEALCACLGDGPIDEGILTYAGDLLDRWPDDIARALPASFDLKADVRALCNTLRLQATPQQREAFVLELHEGATLARLQTLNMSGADVGFLDQLLATQGLPNLQTLLLRLCSLSVSGQPIVFDARWPCLRTVNLESSPLSAPVLDAMGQSGLLDHVEHLNLGECDLEEDLVLQLLSVLPQEARLKSLDLSRNVLTVDDLHDIMRHPAMSTLTSLELRDNSFDPEECQLLLMGGKPEDWTLPDPLFRQVLWAFEASFFAYEDEWE